jgi:uncharacterized protein (DUF2062 family)
MLSLLAIIIFLGGKGGSQPPVALSTLIGAVVGGTLSLLGTVLVERQRNKAADKAEHRRRQLEGRLAARLIAAELEDAQTVLRVALQNPYSWPPNADFQFQMGAWSAHSAALADAVPDSQWELVAGPYFSYRYANLLGDVKKSAAETMLDATGQAISALKEWIESIDDS